MERVLLFQCLLFMVGTVFYAQSATYDAIKQTQKDSTVTTHKRKVIIINVPTFPGEDVALRAFLRKCIRYPDVAYNAHIEAIVPVKFVVKADGNIDSVKVESKGNSVLDAEAIRVISLLPKWKPATKNGVPIRYDMQIPITFKITAPKGKIATKKVKGIK